MNLPQTLVLEGQYCTLVSLSQAHLPQLARIAADPIIWQYLPVKGYQLDTFWNWIEDTMRLKAAGTAHPFAVINSNTHQIIGTSRFQDIQPEHNKMDIGWTWFTPSVWGSKVNTEAKNLMLNYAFEECGVARIGFKVDENNKRSQRALEKIGASKEGVFKKHMIRPDGTARTSFFYGITDDDWLAVKRQLGYLLNQSFERHVHLGTPSVFRQKLTDNIAV